MSERFPRLSRRQALQATDQPQGSQPHERFGRMDVTQKTISTEVSARTLTSVPGDKVRQFPTGKRPTSSGR